MIVGTAHTLWSSPLKGAHGKTSPYLTVDPTLGVMYDRQYALRRRPGGDLTAWAPKAAFFVCMNTPQMAKERPLFNGGRLTSGELHPLYLLELAGRLGVEGNLQVQYAANKYSLHDTKGAFVSLLNLASVRALSEFMGVEVDPHRFRMNIWMTGLEPFEELNWVDAYPGTNEIQVGECRLRVDDACERCKAPEANPDTGKYDLEIQAALDAMMSQRGYKSPHRGVPRVMGILAAPLYQGTIQVADKIELL
jgi:uncharacterized protein YcbX